MCLDVIYRGKQKKDALAKLPESGYYWKVVDVDVGSYVAPTYYTRFAPGWNYTKPKYKGLKYSLGFHIFRRKVDAKNWKEGYSSYFHGIQKLIRCKIEKKDIVAIGTQSGNYLQNGLCIVTTRFWCPKPKGAKK